MNQSEAQAEGIGNGSRTLGTTSIRADNNPVPEVGNLTLDVALQKRLSVEVINGYVEETLVPVKEAELA